MRLRMRTGSNTSPAAPCPISRSGAKAPATAQRSKGRAEETLSSALEPHLVEVAGVEPASEAIAGRRLQAYPRVRISTLTLPRGGMMRIQLSKVHRTRESTEMR